VTEEEQVVESKQEFCGQARQEAGRRRRKRRRYIGLH
jgi:hypothetical protein